MTRLVFLYGALLLAHINVRSQNNLHNPSKDYDTATQRLLIKVVGTHLYNINQWQIDYDSSIVLACKGEDLSHALYRNESFDDGTGLPGSQLIEAGNIRGARNLLTTLQGTDRIKLLLELGAYYLFIPGYDKSDMNNAYFFLKNAQLLSDSTGIPKWKNASRSMMGKFYFDSEDFAKSKTAFTEVANYYGKMGDNAGLANALAERGIYTRYSDTGKLVDLTKALALFRRRQDKTREIEMLSRTAEVHFVYAKYEESKKDLLDAINIQNEIGFKHTQYFYNALAYIEAFKGNHNIALSYGNKAVASMEQTNDRAFSSLFYFRMGNIYGTLGEADKSIYWYRKSLSNKDQNVSDRIWYNSFIFLAIVYTWSGNAKEALDLIDSTTSQYPPLEQESKMMLATVKGQCFDQLNKTALAEKYFRESADMADQLSSQFQMHVQIALCYLENAWFQIGRKNFKKAKYYIQKQQALNPGTAEAYSEALKARVLFKIDSSEGRYVSAIRAYQRLVQLNDSIYNLQKARQIDEMGIQYGLAQKEKDFQLLQKKEELQLVALTKEKLIRNIIVIIAVLLAILFALGFNRYRIKQRHTKEIDEKNATLEKLINDKDSLIADKDVLLKEKDWLVKEIHHRVKNNLQIVISLLNAQSEFLSHPSALNAIRESRERMQAIAILHQKLYQLDNSSQTDMREYIHELVENIKSSVADSGRLNFEVIVGKVSLDISQSVPIGLILNEAITNAIKYAYPKNEKGSILVSLQNTGPQQLQLKIADHGKGLPADMDITQVNSLGLQLIKLFAEQLEGDLFFINNNGLEIVFNFKPAEYTTLPGENEISAIA
jgi:two-component sensor histidine kinase